MRAGTLVAVAIDLSDPWIENRPTRVGVVALRELWPYRELVYFLALRDLKARYKQAFFGISWAIIQPVAGVTVFTIVFRKLASISSGGIPYLAFAFLGLLVWTYFAASVNAATTSLVANAALVTKVYFPRIAAPVAALVPGLAEFAIGLVLLAAIMVHYRIVPGWAAVTLPAWLLAAMIVALGAGLLVASLNVKYRDVGAVMPVLVQLWLLATPVAYPSSLVHGGWRWVYALNPMAAVVDGFRWSLLGAEAPGTEALVSVAAAIALLAFGLLYFLRTERKFADVI